MTIQEILENKLFINTQYTKEGILVNVIKGIPQATAEIEGIIKKKDELFNTLAKKHTASIKNEIELIEQLKELEILKQSEVCENCIYLDKGIVSLCLLTGRNIYHPERQSSLDFKRKEG